ncbi:MAG TPA: hypothetical protein VFW25_14275 [Silvibacterium sp.]|nr:hypothetical protein [Silvibacterium sp.]
MALLWKACASLATEVQAIFMPLLSFSKFSNLQLQPADKILISGIATIPASQNHTRSRIVASPGSTTAFTSDYLLTLPELEYRLAKVCNRAERHPQQFRPSREARLALAVLLK